MEIQPWRTPSHISHPTALGLCNSQKVNSRNLTAGIRTDRLALLRNTMSRIHQHLRQYLLCVDLQASRTILSQDWKTMKCLVVGLENVCSHLRNLESLLSTSAHRNISPKTCSVLLLKQVRIREEIHRCHIKLVGDLTFSSKLSRSHVTRTDLVRSKKRSTSQ